MAGGSAEADAELARDSGRGVGQWEIGLVAVVCAAATVFFGLFPTPLFDVARDAGAALANLL